jgi:hypothetical protein
MCRVNNFGCQFCGCDTVTRLSVSEYVISAACR